MKMSYGRFAAMIVTSTVVMFGLMYLNTYALDHVYFSETRAYMALVMGATMAVIMLGIVASTWRSRWAAQWCLSRPSGWSVVRRRSAMLPGCGP